MNAEPRYTKPVICAVMSSSRIQSGVPGIWHTELRLFYCRKYRRGSRDDCGRPVDGLLESYGDRGITIRFQHDTRHPEAYAGEVSFQLDSRDQFKLVKKLRKARDTVITEFGWDGTTPERLVQKLGALVVEYDDDYRLYFAGVQPGEPPLASLARQG